MPAISPRPAAANGAMARPDGVGCPSPAPCPPGPAPPVSAASPATPGGSVPDTAFARRARNGNARRSGGPYLWPKRTVRGHWANRAAPAPSSWTNLQPIGDRLDRGDWPPGRRHMVWLAVRSAHQRPIVGAAMISTSVVRTISRSRLLVREIGPSPQRPHSGKILGGQRKTGRRCRLGFPGSLSSFGAPPLNSLAIGSQVRDSMVETLGQRSGFALNSQNREPMLDS